jgi:hypothetical protein
VLGIISVFVREKMPELIEVICSPTSPSVGILLKINKKMQQHYISVDERTLFNQERLRTSSEYVKI